MLLRRISLHTLFLCFLAMGAAHAQAPVFKYAPSNTTSGAFVFGNTLARHNQTLYPPGSIAGPLNTGGLITRVYFRYGSNAGNPGTNTLDSVVISLGQTDSLQLPRGNSFNNKFFGPWVISPVATLPQLVIPAGTEGQWIPINVGLFTYDSSKSLIVDIKFKNSANQVFGAQSTGVFGPRLRVYADNFRDTTGSSSSSLVPHFGFDLATSVKPSLASLGIQVAPNPAQGTIRMQVPVTVVGKTYTVLDAAGRTVLTGNFAANTRIAVPVKGLYVVRALGLSQRVVVE